MRSAGRRIAFAVTIVFLVLAAPFLALSVLTLAQGVPLPGPTAVVFVIYLVVLIGAVVFWLRASSSKTA